MKSLLAISIFLAMLLPTGICHTAKLSVAPLKATISEPQGDTEMTKSVDELIAQAQKTYNINLALEAESRIKQEFSEQGQYLQYTFTRLRLDSNERRWLLGTLVEEYLCDLRDQKGRAFSMNVQFSTVVQISAEAVAKFPVKEYLARVRKVLDGPKPGRLEVASTPEQASITIDGEDRGDTCKPFVVSPGTHNVHVHGTKASLNCTADVTVDGGKTERFCCPKGSGCPKWRDQKRCSAP
jgi:PEGA domain